MYLHLGRDVVVTGDDIIGVFDMDTSTWSKKTKRFLTACEKKGLVVTVSEELPRSAVLCRAGKGGAVVYISPLSTQTLLRRSQSQIY